MRRTKDIMYPLIEKWEYSGMSQAEFVKEHNISLPCFTYWRSVYLREKRLEDLDTSGFIRVKQENAIRSGMIELIFPNGVRAIFYQANPELIRSLVN